MAAVFVVYWPAQRNGFVWDDTALVGRDPLIRSWRLIPEAFGHFLFLDATASNFYRPLQRITFMADYALWEMTPRGYHLTSIYVHLAAAVLLFLLAAKWLPPPRNRLYALAIALVWAIHPLHTSAVTYVAGRADPLAAMFGFGSLLLALYSLENTPRARLCAIGAALGFLGALLSKESGVFALLAWVLVLAFRRSDRTTWIRWGAMISAVLLIYASLRLASDRVPPPVNPPPAWTARPALAAQAFAQYAELLLAPRNLHMERDVRKLPNPSGRTLAGLGVFAAICGWAWWSRRRAPQASLALGIAALAYLPISNLLPLNATVAEHWVYVPSAFLLLAAGASLQGVLKKPMAAAWAGTLIVGWSLWLGYLTHSQQSYWLNERTFLTRTIAAGSDSARMRVCLGNLEAAGNQPEIALQQYQMALDRAPGLPFALMGIASVEIRRANYSRARECLNQAASQAFFEPDRLQLYALLEQREQARSPLPLLHQALQAAPYSWHIRKRYLASLAQSGHRPEAILLLQAFLKDESFRASSWQLLGDLLLEEHRVAEAAAAYERASELDVRSTPRVPTGQPTPPAPPTATTAPPTATIDKVWNGDAYSAKGAPPY